MDSLPHLLGLFGSNNLDLRLTTRRTHVGERRRLVLLKLLGQAYIVSIPRGPLALHRMLIHKRIDPAAPPSVHPTLLTCASERAHRSNTTLSEDRILIACSVPCSAAN